MKISAKNKYYSFNAFNLKFNYCIMISARERIFENKNRRGI